MFVERPVPAIGVLDEFNEVCLSSCHGGLLASKS
jgi:hypothetical protein